jgi:outer membrane lipoprotein-sorting protein
MRYDQTMPNHRIVLTLAVAVALPLLALAQTPPPGQAPPAPPTPAELTLDAAIEKLKAITSVRADIRQDVDMLGQKFSVVGQYLKGADYRVRLQLTIEGLPDTEGQMLQVCDGKVLWDYSKILGQEYFSRMEVLKVLDRLNSPEFDETMRSYYVQQKFGLSGPQALLEGLRQSAKFDTQEEGDLDGKAVWILRGRWSDMSPLGLGPMAPIPSYVPSVISVWVGKEDGWPYQVVMQGKKRPDIAAERKIQLGPDGRPVGSIVKQDNEPLSRFSLRYENVELNPTLSATEFFFTVADSVAQNVRDTTSENLAELDNIAKFIATQKQMEAAKSGGTPPGDLLKQGIDIPSPETPAPTPPPVTPVPGTPPPG